MSDLTLYVCWGTFQVPGVREHPCRIAHEALVSAGHDPAIVKTHGFGGLPRKLQTGERKKVEDNTGSKWVPALETGDGEWTSGSQRIVAWADQHARV